MNRMTLHFDGGGSSKGGPGGWGAVLSWPDGTVEAEEHGWLEDATNNDAEYAALIYGLQLARLYNPRHLEVVGDSQLVLFQVTPRWWTRTDVNGYIIFTPEPQPDPLPARRYVYRTKGRQLAALHARAVELLGRFDEYSLRWTKRTGNQRADALATKAQKERAPLTRLPL